MFKWFREHRRKKITQVAFPISWEEILRRNVAHYSMLEDTERANLRALIQVFIAEKNWCHNLGSSLSAFTGSAP
jgi:Mlc titration factor MtfA (ptsG expression regulator)